jgi:hypothetical protein
VTVLATALLTAVGVAVSARGSARRAALGPALIALIGLVAAAGRPGSTLVGAAASAVVLLGVGAQVLCRLFETSSAG